MSDEQHRAAEYWQSAPEAVNPGLSAEYDTSPEALHTPESRLGDNQVSDENGRLEASKRKIWGMKRKTFMIGLGTIIIIIAVAAGVGGGVAAKNDNVAPRSTSTSASHGSQIAISTTSHLRSPTPTPILKNTPLAAANLDTGAIEFFYKDTDHNIRLLQYNGSKWGKSSDPIFEKPKDDSGIAAITWLEEGRQQVRVYTVSEDNFLRENLWDSTARSWSTNPIGKMLEPSAAGSQLTAYTWFANEVRNIRVYYQGEDGYIREAAWTSGSNATWGKGNAPSKESFPQARRGSGLAVVLFPEKDPEGAKLFYQNMDGRLVSYDYKKGTTFAESWQKSTQDYGYIPDGTHITVVFNKSGKRPLRIYFIQDEQLKEVWWQLDGGARGSWNMNHTAAPGVAAITYSDDVRVLFQRETANFSVYSFNQNRHKWEVGWVE